MIDVPLPPKDLQDFAGGAYREVGDEFVRHLQRFCGLRNHTSVLDVGCGPGRLASALLRSGHRGHYTGFDCHARSVGFCKDEVTPRCPTYHFHLADVANGTYNPTSPRAASDYSFPEVSNSVDVVVAMSVFTHLMPAAAGRYLSESLRVLRPGGKMLATFFLLDEESRGPKALRQFPFQVGPLVWSVSAEHPEGAVAYDRATTEAVLQLHGFKDVEVHPGLWRGRSEAVTAQDLVVARKE